MQQPHELPDMCWTNIANSCIMLYPTLQASSKNVMFSSIFHLYNIHTPYQLDRTLLWSIVAGKPTIYRMATLDSLDHRRVTRRLRPSPSPSLDVRAPLSKWFIIHTHTQIYIYTYIYIYIICNPYFIPYIIQWGSSINIVNLSSFFWTKWGPQPHHCVLR